MRALAPGSRRVAALVAVALAGIAAPGLDASGHGPLFGMATPTNAARGFAIDMGAMGRSGEEDSAMALRTMLTYGIHEDVQISVSAPVVFASAGLPASRMSGMMPGGGDIEAIGAWRFQRRSTGVGSRVESTAYAGLLVPGPQRPAGLAGTFDRAPGLYAGTATGFVSRGHYVWAGAGYTRYARRGGDRRPTLFSYSAVWGYRPPPMRREYPHWDWRLFAELSGERSTRLVHAGAPMPGTGAHQVFAGPSTLGIYKSYAVEAGIQFPLYRDTGVRLGRERFRLAANLSYFF